MPLSPFAYISPDHGAKSKRLTEMSTIGKLNHLTERMGLLLPYKHHKMAHSESRTWRRNDHEDGDKHPSTEGDWRAS